MILGVPCFENHALTAQMVESLAQTVRGPDFTLVIVDNASPTPYRRGDYDIPFRLRVIRNERNEGNFWPLAQVAQLEPGHGVVALAHNDVILYEPGWNLRVEAAFRDDPRLGMLGFAGDDAIGRDGERVSTMSNLRGTRGHTTAEAAGMRVTDLRPAAAVDGIFMAWRREALPALTLEPTMPPAHFFDRIWGAQVQEAGWRLATLGVECDHVGWSTEVRQAAALDAEWRRWAAEAGVEPGANVMDAIWEVGSRRWAEFRGRFWPCRVGPDWVRRPTGRVVAVSMFRNEEDVAASVVRHMLAEVDLVVVADNRSTDATRLILEGIASEDPRLRVIDEPSLAYHQAQTMNGLAELAAAAGAEWIVPFDADEWWDADGSRIVDALMALPGDLEATAARTWDMIPQPDDPADPDPFRRIRWTRPGSLWSRPDTRKVAFRPGPGRVLLQGNHGLEGRPPAEIGPLRVRHFPFRTFDQARAKLRHGRLAVLAADLGPVSGGHWQEWGALDDAGLAAWWDRWTARDGLEAWAG